MRRAVSLLLGRKSRRLLVTVRLVGAPVSSVGASVVTLRCSFIVIECYFPASDAGPASDHSAGGAIGSVFESIVGFRLIRNEDENPITAQSVLGPAQRDRRAVRTTRRSDVFACGRPGRPSLG
jgi:hypothetical protein